MMKYLKLILILTLLITSVYSQGIRNAIEVLDKGIEAYQADNMEQAATNLENAVVEFDNLLKGMTSPEDAAYSRYYRATALYYLGRIKEDINTFADASKAFEDAINDLVGIELLGDEYVRSKYLRALCSFRQFQMTSVSTQQNLYLENAIGDLQSFLDDTVVVKSGGYLTLTENSTFLLAFAFYTIGELESFNVTTYSTAKDKLNESIKYFQRMENAENAKLSVAAKFYEGESHYQIARLYMRVSKDKWDARKLASGDRNSAIEDELFESQNLLDEAANKAGAYPDMKLNIQVNEIINKVALAGIGDKEALNEAQSELIKLKDNQEWSEAILLNIAYTQLIRFLLFDGNPRTVSANFSKVASFSSIAYYWSGWVNYIISNYKQAALDFNKFSSAVPGRDTKWQERKADAKFRLAESYFWMGIKESNVGNLKSAENIYKALNNTQGEYYRYLDPKDAAISNTRLFLIDIESTLGKSADIENLQTVMELAGLKLPENADDYLEVGKYFLQKGIETAEKQRETALKFAQKAFELVVNSNVSGDIKNRAKFLKGVTLVKLSTVYSGAEQEAVLNDARSILGECSAPYANEADYVKGISYFITNDFANAKSIFNSLKIRGHIRATFYYALSLSKGECREVGAALKKIQATVKDRTDYWYRNASNEISNLDCKGDLPPQQPFQSVMQDPPMTYENLVDPAAEQARKKEDALAMWQRVSEGKNTYPLDELVTDKPPKTNVEITFNIQPSQGGELLAIDGDAEIAQEIEGGYKAEVTRGAHDVTVQKKGFYLWEDKISVTRTRAYEITLSKAVRYTKAEDIGGINATSGMYALENDFFVANNEEGKIIRYNRDGVKVASIDLRKLSLGYCSGIAVDGDRLLIADARKNQIVSCDLTGADKKIIAYGNEQYGQKSIVKVSDLCVFNATYFVVDNGNGRILRFEGETFRREFGSDNLSKPYGLAISPFNENIYVADWGEGAIVVFNKDGQLEKKVELSDQPYPTRIFIDKNGYLYISDFISNNVIKYGPNFKKVGTAQADFNGPRGLTLVGEGPEASLLVADQDKVVIFKGSWDNAYMPE